jgi:hypothetical protein
MGQSSIEFRNHIKRLDDELTALEMRADVAEKATKINEGCFISYGIDGEGDDLPKNQQSENYFDFEFDHRRNGIRDLYFQIPDSALRKALIENVRIKERLLNERAIEDKAAALSELQRAQNSADKSIHVSAILITLVAIGIGIYEGGSKGFSIGAMGALYSYLHQKDLNRRLRVDVEQAKHTFELETESANEYDVRPEYFSLREALNGERDDSLDRVSARYLRAMIRNKEQTLM